MALGDWTTYPATNFQYTLNVTTPLVGNASLRLVDTASTGTKAANMHLGGTFSKGFLKGRIRTIIRNQATVLTTSSTQRAFGIAFMQSSLDMRTVGNGYMAWWGLYSVSQVAGQLSMGIAKYNTNVGFRNLPVHLAATTPFAVSPGDHYPFQVEWVYDLINIGGTRITVSRGTLNTLDYNSLVPVSGLDIIDSASPLATSVAEGLAYTQSNTVNGGMEFNWDETTIFELL